MGWVGLVTAACFAELGHEVYARDIVQEKVESLARGEVPIYEPGLSELIAKNSERLHFTTEMEDVLPQRRLLFCCVDTPPDLLGRRRPVARRGGGGGAGRRATTRS